MSNARPRPLGGSRGGERAGGCGIMRGVVVGLQSIMLPAARAMLFAARAGILVMQLERKRRALASRVAAVHLAICGLAILAAGLVQIPWDAMLGGPGFASWSGRAMLAAFAATAWLL